MEILILLMYVLFFVVGDFLGKNANKNIDLEMMGDSICFTRRILFLIFIVFAMDIYLNNINNSTIAFLIVGLGLGFEKGQGNFADFSWLLNSDNKSNK